MESREMLGITAKLRENGLCYSPVTRTRRSPRMRVKLQLVMCNDQGDEETVTDVITLNKNHQRIEHLGLTLMAVWFLVNETHRGQELTPALTLPQVRYGLSLLLLEEFCTPSIDYICRQVHRQFMRNESARFYHHRTRKCIPPRKLRRDIQ